MATLSPPPSHSMCYQILLFKFLWYLLSSLEMFKNLCMNNAIPRHFCMTMPYQVKTQDIFLYDNTNMIILVHIST